MFSSHTVYHVQMEFYRDFKPSVCRFLDITMALPGIHSLCIQHSYRDAVTCAGIAGTLVYGVVVINAQFVPDIRMVWREVRVSQLQCSVYAIASDFLAHFLAFWQAPLLGCGATSLAQCSAHKLDQDCVRGGACCSSHFSAKGCNVMTPMLT